MNFQDISDFLDLVKNPAKADEVLSNILNHKAQLDASIATVGKAQDIERLQRKAVKLVENAEAKAAEIVEAAEANMSKQRSAIQAKIEELQVQEQKVNDFNQESHARMENAKAIEATFNQREKTLRMQEQQSAADSQRLATLMREYEEKSAKLRSAMGV